MTTTTEATRTEALTAGLRASDAPFYVSIRKTQRGTRVAVLRERVIQGQRKYEGVGAIPEAAFSECKGMIQHALRAADHGGTISPGRYGLTEEWGARIAVAAVACYNYRPAWRMHRAVGALIEASSSECQWWLGMMLRPGEAGSRARHAYRIMSEVTDI